MMSALTIDVAGHAVFLPALALAGLGVGFVAGMFGIGGGFILTPLLTVGFGIPAPVAVGSALCQKIGTSIGSFAKYRQLRYGEPRVDWIMMGGSLIGVQAGTAALRALDRMGNLRAGSGALPAVNVAIEGLYALLLVTTAIVTLRSLLGRGIAPGRAAGDHTTAGPLARLRLAPHTRLPRVGMFISVPIMAYLGFLTGALSGLLGIGGGVALLPILVYGYGFSLRDAAGTGILVMFATVVAGTAAQAWYGQIDLRVAMGILFGSSIGAQLGARTTHRLSNRALRVAFCMLIAGAAIAIIAHLGVRLLG
jgi:uncharacterized membrane protein YfcA